MAKTISSGTTYLVRCHLHTLKFTPYNDVPKSNADIIIDAITFLNKEKLAGKAFLVNKHKNRKDEEPRELFMHVASIGYQRKNCEVFICID